MRQPGMRGRSSANRPERIARPGASERASTSLSGPFARFASQSSAVGSSSEAASASNTSTATPFARTFSRAAETASGSTSQA